MKFEWEELDEDTRRVKVIGGWIVVHDYNSNGESMVFVPDPKHGWRIEE